MCGSWSTSPRTSGTYTTGCPEICTHGFDLSKASVQAKRKLDLSPSRAASVAITCSCIRGTSKVGRPGVFVCSTWRPRTGRSWGRSWTFVQDEVRLQILTMIAVWMTLIPKKMTKCSGNESANTFGNLHWNFHSKTPTPTLTGCFTRSI